jgi:hypothetical protein
LPAVFSNVSFYLRKRWSLGSVPVNCLQTDSWLKRFLPHMHKKK